MKRFNTKTVQKLLSQQETPPHLSQTRAERILPPTKYQWKLLRKLNEADRGDNGPKADRGVYKRERQKACKSVMGRDVRRIYVMEALDEIDAAKKSELNYIRDEHRRTVGGRPRYSPAASRRRKRAVARDVSVWLAWKKLGKFCLKTIKEDIRCVKK